MTARRNDAGLSLLELAAVMAIFSVLALLAIQLLSQGITSRDQLAQADTRVAELSSAVAVLRRDLEHLVPLPQGDGPRPIFAIRATDITMATASAPLVTWRHDPRAKTFSRETASGSIVMLQDVTVVAWQTFGAAGWQSGEGWRGAGPSDLPRGISVTLRLSDMGDVPVVVAR